MSDFQSQLQSASASIAGAVRDAFTHACEEVERSVRNGSEITGAPGQPVDQYELKPSWRGERLSDVVWQFTTNVAYAQAVEDGIQPPYTSASGKSVAPKPMTLRSNVGGFHSVALTRAGWDRIVDHVTAPAK